MAEGVVHPFHHYTWKHGVLHWVLNIGAIWVANQLIPGLPPLWAAILFAAIFALMAVVLPLVIARRRMRRGELEPAV